MSANTGIGMTCFFFLFSMQLKTQLEQSEANLHNEHILREKLAAEFEEVSFNS